MIKLFSICFLAIIIFITGCTTKVENKSTTNQEQKNELSDQTFQKRIVCENYRSKVIGDLEMIEKRENFRIAKNKSDERPYYLPKDAKWPVDVKIYYTLEELFYSPQQDSCLFSAIRVAVNDNKTNGYAYSLSDVFTGIESPIFIEWYDVSKSETNYLDRVGDFWTKVNSYK